MHRGTELFMSLPETQTTAFSPIQVEANIAELFNYLII